MKILSIDTSTQVGSVAILDEEKICAETSYQTKSSHAEVLMKEIDRTLKKSGLVIGDIDGIAVAIGPGSFTGLRIGLATAKGLAIATGKPIVGISSLQALAFSLRANPPEAGESRSHALSRGSRPAPSNVEGLRSNNIIVPCINAYRGEVYCTIPSPLGPRPPCSSGGGEGHLPAGGSVAGGEGADVTCECSITPEALCELLCRGGALPPPNSGGHGDPPLLFIGDGAVHYKDLFKEKLGKRFKEIKPKRTLAASAGLLSIERFKRGDTADLIKLVPNYIRKSDAEIKSKLILDSLRSRE